MHLTQLGMAYLNSISPVANQGPMATRPQLSFEQLPYDIIQHICDDLLLCIEYDKLCLEEKYSRSPSWYIGRTEIQWAILQTHTLHPLTLISSRLNGMIRHRLYQQVVIGSTNSREAFLESTVKSSQVCDLVSVLFYTERTCGNERDGIHTKDTELD